MCTDPDNKSLASFISFLKFPMQKIFIRIFAVSSVLNVQSQSFTNINKCVTHMGVRTSSSEFNGIGML